MTLEYPTFLVNFKLYAGTAGEEGLDLAETIASVAERTGASLAVAPQTPDLYRIASETDLPVVAQSADAVKAGRGTGKVALPTVAAAGADGVLVNHPESPQTLSEIESIVESGKDQDVESIVCVDSVETGRAVLAFDPDCLLFEKPADIGTGRSLPRTAPERVEAFVSMVEETNPRTRVLLGGGISSPADVEAALKLGVDAAGAASAFVDATDREAWLSEVAETLVSGPPADSRR